MYCQGKRRQIVLEEDPYRPKITAFSLSKSFKKPMIETYNRVMDPFDYLQTFVALMRLYAVPDTMMSLSFPSMLERQARDWLATLALHSIRTFMSFLGAL